jgi:hypothetical protein
LAVKLVQPAEDPWLEALQGHAVGALDLLVHPGVYHGPIHTNMVIVTEIKELFAGELLAIVVDDIV